MFKGEIDFTRWFCSELLKCNCFIQAVVGSEMQMPGWPDRYVVHRLWRGHLEFKWEGGRTRPAQVDVMRELLKRGCPAIIVRGFKCGLVRFENAFDDYYMEFNMENLNKLQGGQVGGYLLNWIIRYCEKLDFDKFSHMKGRHGEVANRRRKALEG